MIEIIHGTPDDVAAIMPVMNDAFDPEFGEAWSAAQCLSALSMPCSQLFLAKSNDDAVVGFAISRWVMDEEELLMIGVLSEFRKQRVASSLLDKIRNDATFCGRIKIFLEVREDNSARNFYHNYGFSEIGRRRGYYTGRDGKTRDAVTMHILL